MDLKWLSNIDWFIDFGPYGLFLLAFIEAVFFLVPPDVMLLPLAIARPSLSLLYALITTTGSVLGGLFGYFLGRRAGRPLLLRFASLSRIKQLEELFDKYGAWAVATAALTPIPYKVFTIGGGIFRVRLLYFTIASLAGRGLRFGMEALLVMMLGERATDFFYRDFEWLTIAIALVAVVVALVVAKRKQ
ncbi:MAG TPA: DedA family protein [Firmicutes bacterium]|nr:DedA family protein [Candidatus Fermentithermobacillaceae bacterium]